MENRAESQPDLMENRTESQPDLMENRAESQPDLMENRTESQPDLTEKQKESPRSATEKKKQSEKYLLWQLKKLKDKVKTTDEFWMNKDVSSSWTIDCLQAKVKTLEEELQASKNTTEELKNKLCLTKADNQRLVLENNTLKTSNCLQQQRQKEIQIHLEHQISKSEGSYRRNLARITEQAENVKSRMQVDFEQSLFFQKQGAARTVKELQDRLQEKNDSESLKVSQLQQQLSLMQQKYKKQVTSLEKQLAEKDKTLAHLEEEVHMSSYRNQDIYKEQELTIQQQIQTIAELKRSEDSLNRRVSKLKETITEKNIEIRDREDDIATLKYDKANITSDLVSEKEKNTLHLVIRGRMKANIKTLEKEKSDTQDSLDKIKDDFKTMTITNRKLNDQIKNLTYQVKASEPDLAKLRAKIAHLETSLLRIKEDIQACMTDVEKPKKLRLRVLKLKRHYIEDEERIQVDENTRKAFQHHTKCLQRKLDYSANILQSHSSERSNLQDRLLKAHKHLIQTRGYFIRLLNEKIKTEHMLRHELKEAKSKLQKATKPASEKLRSWLNKKVLQSAPVVKQAPEQTPNFYPEDWEPLGPLDDDTSVSPEHHYVMHMSPFVDKMPPVEV
ncbi:uncharacterized protein [Trachinotus anak]|uniref:uncharacterized protein n=1 Tax=Trachinotus anak TaxID=443729 RepID=UPI0039F24F38